MAQGMRPRPLTCKHCGAVNPVLVCECGRGFVLTKSRIQKGMREFDDQAVESEAVIGHLLTCDYCAAKVLKLPPQDRIAAALRQKTCPSCHTEFLSDHGL